MLSFIREKGETDIYKIRYLQIYTTMIWQIIRSW